MYYSIKAEITLYDEDMDRLNNPDIGIVKKGDVIVQKGIPRKPRTQETKKKGK